MMKNILISLILVFCSGAAWAQLPKSGTYYYTLRQAEHPNLKSSKPDCKVVINGEKIQIFYLGKSLSGTKKGGILDQGILIKHKSGKWIIGKKKSDSDIEEIGGCSNGPNEIDFTNLYFWIC